ncbi:hypothetical protein [Mycobacterium sp. NPDC050853]|uniref:hypothetical protein n=1 Tax=Mycobacterium sp. NPDC050853 TaxID=3155160 RepID=UPI003408576F
MINAEEKPAGFVGPSDLLAAGVGWPARDYQREAIDAVVTGFCSTDSGRLITVCDTGKTLTAQFITMAPNAQRPSS